MRYAILTVATLFFSAPPARAVVVSDHVGSHTTTPSVPAFLGGAIAGVIASGVGAAAFEPFPPGVTSSTDSSWGEVFIDTRVSYYHDFLTTATGGQATFVVPEPSSFMLLLAALVCSQRWRRLS